MSKVKTELDIYKALINFEDLLKNKKANKEYNKGTVWALRWVLGLYEDD